MTIDDRPKSSRNERKVRSLIEQIAPIISETAKTSIARGTPLSDLVLFLIAEDGHDVAFGGTADVVRGKLHEDEFSILGERWQAEACEHVDITEKQPAHGLVRLILYSRYGWTRARLALTGSAVS